MAGQPFDESWTLEHSQRSIALEERREADRDEGATQAWLAQLGQMAGSLVGHLEWLGGQGRLTVPAHTEAVEHPLMDAWRALAGGQGLEARVRERLVDGCKSGLLVITSQALRAAQQETGLDEAGRARVFHATLTDLVARGKFCHMGMEGFSCLRSGLHLRLTFDDWQVRCQVINPDTRTISDLAQGQVLPDRIEQVALPVPSGRLLVCDWFEHAAFRQFTDRATKDGPSINSGAGCVARTQRLAELGMGSVFVGNSSPDIFPTADGAVVVGHEDFEAPEGACGLSRAGSVCTDLWWTTMVDAQVLAEIIARESGVPMTQANEEVDAMIQNQASPITELRLAPGTYQLYFSSDPQRFAELFDLDAPDVGRLETPMFLLHPRQLAPRAKPARGLVH